MKELKRHQGQQFRRFQDEQGKIYCECKGCKKILPVSSQYFYKQKTTKSGFRSTCKQCCDDYHMNRYWNEEGFKDAALQYSKQWCKNNRDKVNTKARKRRQRRLEKDPESLRKQERDRLLEWKDRQPAGIYKITCLNNNRVYIGETSCIPMRWISHKSDLKRPLGKTNPLLQEDWDKYGESSFQFEVIEETKKDKDFLYERELYFIKKYHSEGYELYNKERLEDK